MAHKLGHFFVEDLDYVFSTSDAWREFLLERAFLDGFG